MKMKIVLQYHLLIFLITLAFLLSVLAFKGLFFKDPVSISKSAQGLSHAVMNFRRAQYAQSLVAQSQGQAALGTVKNVVKLALETVINTGKLLIEVGKAIVELAAGAWWILVLILLVIIMFVAVAALISSGYGIFFSDEVEENEITIQEIVREINTDYQKKLEDLVKEYDRASVSLIRYEGSKAQWKYVIALYAVKYSDEGEVIFVNDKTKERIKKIFYDIHSFEASYTYEESPYIEDQTWEILVIKTNAKSLSEMMDKYKFDEEDRALVAELVDQSTDELWNTLFYGHNGNGGYALIEIAKEQLGHSAQAYTSWFDIKDYKNLNWSGCFVSWCANEAGYVVQGLYPKTNNLDALADWFRDKGLWEDPNGQPNVGDTIFIDANQDGIIESCGFVEKVEDNKLYYIGTSSVTYDVVERSFVSLQYTNSRIVGYGVLPQMSGLRGDTVEEKIYNYLRQNGYSAVSAAAVLASVQADCSCDPNIFAVRNDYYTGLFHWRGSDMNDLFDWCNANALDWRNLESQLLYYEYWLKESESNFGTFSSKYHLNIVPVTNAAQFKSIKASDFDGDTALAIYNAVVLFTDDIDRPVTTDISRRYTYAIQFYNYMTGAEIDGSTVSAWRNDLSGDIGIYHVY